MTEDEARQKWCPFVRTAKDWLAKGWGDNYSSSRMPTEQGLVAASVNRGYGIEDRCNCIASDCMAWRWLDPENAEETHGYCGLAGKI